MSRTVDVSIEDHGTLLAFRPASAAVRAWFDANVASEPWQWRDGGLCVDARFADDLIAGLREAGFALAAAAAAHAGGPGRR